MRRGTVLVSGVMVLCMALPQGAAAEPKSLPGALLGIITAPIGAIVGTVERMGRKPRHSRRPAVRQKPSPATAAHPRPATPTPSASKTATAANPPAASTAAPATQVNPHPAEKPALRGTAAAAASVAATGVAATGVAATGVAATGTEAARSNPSPNAALGESTPLPLPAPRDRSAALAGPPEMPRGPAHQAARPRHEPSPLGVFGPLAWPSAYEDVIGFTLWPQAYGERLRVHGIGDVLATMFTPASTAASRSRVELARAETDAPVGAIPSAGPVRACNGLAHASADWPADQIERSIKLTSEQRDAFEQFKAAVKEAIATINAACRDEPAETPVERLRSMQNALWAIHDAAVLIRSPLAKFYEALTDEQRKQFLLPASQANQRAMAHQVMNRGDFARMCGMPPSEQWPMRQIEQALEPNNGQRASLDALQKKLFEMGQFLMASCLQPIQSTPMERLDSAADRLTAVIFATSAVSLALNDFYNQLSERQKSKFVSLSH